MSHPNPNPAPIAIIGGGPSGLTLARLLQIANIPYIVFERDPQDSSDESQSQGGTLDLHAKTGQLALKVAGLKDEFEKLARREAAVFTIQDSRGENRFSTATLSEGKHGNRAVDRPEIDRVQLRRILLDSLPEDRVRWGKALRSVEWDESESMKGKGGAAGWVLNFKDGSSESGFRLVVGADGAWSKVRPLITSAKPLYSGKTYIEGRFTHSNPQYAAVLAMVGPGNSAALGDRRMLAVQQMSDRTYRIYAGIEEPESLTRPGGIVDFAADVEKSRAALLELFAGWAPHLRAYLEDAEGPWRVWPLYHLDSDIFLEGKGWNHVPGVTLIGDAAHVGLPNGEGVNIAMLDALKLVECLSAELGTGIGAGEKGGESFDSVADAAAVERAVVAYEAEMRVRAREHIKAGIMLNDTMYKADGAQRMTAMFEQLMEAAKQSSEAA
ncbi:FAD/NAD(P)-binding domain-containing protein [Xylariaceae sp. AK1471]|nr:FAD/NAD(P)-binding domain-containing protein [Xylariaceae sp. AK1471]